jgi:Ca-activated chloride channel homolog
MSVMHAPVPASPTAASPSAGGRLVATDGRALPFKGGELSVDAAGGVARVVLRQRFVNPHAEPLHVTYQVPLPSDAAVSGYAFELGELRIVGEVDTKRSARERFEEALVDGRTAALLEQDRSSLFTQEVGNVPPGVEVVCELILDQKLVWHAAGWEWRFPTTVAPRYLGAPGRVPDAARVSVDVAESDTGARITLGMTVRDALSGPATSPSHALHIVVGDAVEIGVSDESGAALDRDVVVRWPVSAPEPGVSLDLARASAGRTIATAACGLLTVVPPTVPGASVARDLVVLLDTSGSMGGRPLAQAKAVTCALIDSLGDGDQLQLMEFSTRPRAWKSKPVSATRAKKLAATQWVQGLRAGGGTQMRDGILAALATLRTEAQRQVVLVTDGLIGFERQITAAVAENLPRGCRVHTLGIGSGVNRSLLTPVARAGGGIEMIVGLDEAPTVAAAALVQATAAPLVVDLELSGSALIEVAHHRAPDLLAGRPAGLALRLRPEGGSLTVRGHTANGPWQEVLVVPPCALGHGSGAVVTLVGRELVADLEMRAALGHSVDSDIEKAGLDYQIATRKTSWVAISATRTVNPTEPTVRETVPQALPHGMSVAGLGLRAAASSMSPEMGSVTAAPAGPPRPSAVSASRMPRRPHQRPAAPKAGKPTRRKHKKSAGPISSLIDAFDSMVSGAMAPPEPTFEADDEAPAAAAPPPQHRAPQEQEAQKSAERAASPRRTRDEVLDTSELAAEPYDGPAELEPMMDEDDDISLSLGDAEGIEEEATAEVSADAFAAATAPLPSLRATGAILVAKRDRLVLEITVPTGGLAWGPGRSVILQLGDGTRIVATIDATGSTRAQQVAGGRVIRLTLHGQDSAGNGIGTLAGPGTVIWVEMEGARLEVTLVTGRGVTGRG